jgi:hypothetical protein
MMYQILIKVPNTKYDADGNVIGEPHSDPHDVFSAAAAIDSRVGQLHVSNADYTCFGFNSDSNDVSMFAGLPNDVEIVVSEIDEVIV